MLQLVGNRAGQLCSAVLKDDVNRILVQTAALPKVLSNGLRELLVHRGTETRGKCGSGLDMKPGRLLCWQGEGHPQPRGEGKQGTGANYHSNILLTKGAWRATANYPLRRVLGQIIGRTIRIVAP